MVSNPADRLKEIDEQLTERLVAALEQWTEDMEETFGDEKADPLHVAAALGVVTAVSALSIATGTPEGAFIMIALFAPWLFLYVLVSVLERTTISD